MNTTTLELGADEIALYDRQIRLWGLEAQTNIRSARVLLINIGSIGTEITKNIVLSGVGHYTILDAGHIVTEEDLGSQFFLSPEDVGKVRLDAVRNRVQDLNPRVDLSFVHESLDELVSNPCDKFDIIIATELNTEQTLKLNKWTRSNNIPLYTCGSNGLFGYIFVDLIQFEAKDKKLQNIRPSQLGPVSTNKEIIHLEVTPDPDDEKKIYENIITRNKYIPFDEMVQTASLEGKLTRRQLKRVSSILPLTLTDLQDSNLISDASDLNQFKINLKKTCEQLRIDSNLILKPEYVEQFIKQKGVEFTPVAAVLGGAVAQDVINILGKRQQPLNNFVVFDGITLDMPIFEF